MTETELNKLTVGSTVKMVRYPIFVGKVTQVNGNMVEVDYPPNDMTGSSDPQPFWEHFMAIDVVAYAKTELFKEDVLILLGNVGLYSQTLLDQVARFKAKWGI